MYFNVFANYTSLFFCVFGLDKVIGFRFGQYRNGEMTVGEPNDVILVPEGVKAAVKVFF